MERNPPFDIIIRDPVSYTPIDKRAIKNKADELSVLEKYGYIFKLSFKEFMKVYDYDISEVEKYVRERKRTIRRERRNPIAKLKE